MRVSSTLIPIRLSFDFALLFREDVDEDDDDDVDDESDND
jgi:hypothetical protein